MTNNLNEMLQNYLNELLKLSDSLNTTSLISRFNMDGLAEEATRKEISNRVIGFLKAYSGGDRVKEYRQALNFGIYQSDTDIDKTIKLINNMKNFLYSIKEEIEVKTALGVKGENTRIEEVIKKAGNEKDEAERRKNVAEMKYWGFAIELMETVRNQLKSHSRSQEELLKQMKELQNEIKTLQDGINKSKSQR